MEPFVVRYSLTPIERVTYSLLFSRSLPFLIAVGCASIGLGLIPDLAEMRLVFLAGGATLLTGFLWSPFAFNRPTGKAIELSVSEEGLGMAVGPMRGTSTWGIFGVPCRRAGALVVPVGKRMRMAIPLRALEPGQDEAICRLIAGGQAVAARSLGQTDETPLLVTPYRLTRSTAAYRPVFRQMAAFAALGLAFTASSIWFGFQVLVPGLAILLLTIAGTVLRAWIAPPTEEGILAVYPWGYEARVGTDSSRTEWSSFSRADWKQRLLVLRIADNDCTILIPTDRLSEDQVAALKQLLSEKGLLQV